MDMGNDMVHACLHAGLLCTSLLSPRPETLHGTAFSKRDGSIYIRKDGNLDEAFENLEKSLDLEFSLCGQAIFDDWPRRFDFAAMLASEPNHRRSPGFSDAFAGKRIDSLTTLGLAKRGNANMETLGSELKSVSYYVSN
jgi:hypothetical protein